MCNYMLLYVVLQKVEENLTQMKKGWKYVGGISKGK